MPSKTAVLYDFLQVKGGAEAVTLDLCGHFKDMVLIAAWVNRSCFPNLGSIEQRCSFLTSPTGMQAWQTIKCARAFMNNCPDLSDYKRVIFSGSNAPLAILKTKAEKNIYYCHTPPRFIYDLKDHYLDVIPKWQKPALIALISWFRPLYEEAISKMDVVLCNSKNVQGRLKRYMDIEAEVVYPPVNTERFGYISDGDYFLSTARLEPYKRVDVIVRAFMEMPDRKLIVTSGGSQLSYLKNMAKDCANIEFTGWVSEEKLAQLVGNCLATIYIPKDEDFGISPVESIAAQKPVIGVAEGGIMETVIPGRNGWLTPENPTISQLKTVVSNAYSEVTRYAFKVDAKPASLFSRHRFLQEIHALLQ